MPIMTVRITPKVSVTLAKVTDHSPFPYANHGRKITQPLPAYPLHGHRPGLRANDLVTLHSAFVIIAQESGTAHLFAPRHTMVNCQACK